MNSKYLVLKERIIEELFFVKRSMQKAEEAWNKAKLYEISTHSNMILIK